MIHRCRFLLGSAATVLTAANLVSCRGGDDPKARQTTSILGNLRPAADAGAGDPPPVMREFRAAWVATVGNIDWPSKPGLSTEQQQAEIVRILNRCADTNLNAVVLQVRTVADALYDSKIEPWSQFLTGTQGKAPDPYYDPLAVWVAEAHKRGIELHAWFNPYRTRYAGSKAPAAATHISKVRPDLVRDYGKVSWMDPGEPEAADQSFRVFMDVVERYDVDGIHIDDYFYPYPEKGPGRSAGEMPFPDDASYAKYTNGGGKLARNDWRRDNVSRLIERIYKGTKARKPHVLFGISPFGIPRPGLPGIEYVAGFDQYAKLYADTVLWLKNGWCDYFVPQLYWATGAPQQPYLGLLQWWTTHNPKGRFIYGGLYTSRLNNTEKSWTPEEITGQVMQTRVTPGAHGEVHFSMIALDQNRKKVADVLRDGLYAQPALPPAATWLDATPPAPPTEVTATPTAGGGVTGGGAASSPATTESSEPATGPATGPAGQTRAVRVAWRP
ncbi:MAG: hypothetical protein JWO31_2392, partial [Phycisphaerales bacterium]|nr:hypothetical protein [Phycisphaerales bacterium]